MTETITNELSIVKPFDAHLHVRDGNVLKAVIGHSARQFDSAIIMPNLNPPITTTPQADEYKAEIMSALPDKSTFKPLMTTYLTDDTNHSELMWGFHNESWVAAKLYPANATTNSKLGVTDINNIHDVLKAMEKFKIPLLMHGEVVHDDGVEVDPFDREDVFIKKVLIPLRDSYPDLRIVFEHITTKEAVDYVMNDTSGNLAATVTAHHLLITRDDLFRGGLRPHLFCLPVVKRRDNRTALIDAIASGNPNIFCGTDSAPHLKGKKEVECCPGGIYSAHAALELYATVFDKAGALEHFEAFMSLNGSKFYGIKLSEEMVTLRREPWVVKESVPVWATEERGVLPSDQIQPFFLGEELEWKMVG